MENNQNQAQKTNILDIISSFLNYWPILVVSVVIALAVAVFYITFVSRTYTVFSRVAIRTERSNTNRSSSNYVNVSDMMYQERTFTDEVAFLRSSPLIKEVIEDMNLFTSYYTKEDKIPRQFHFGFNNIYKRSPFIVVIDNDHWQPMNTLFYLRVIDNETFVIDAQSSRAYLYNTNTEEISDYGVYFYFGGTYKFGEQLENEYCSFKVLLNSNYNAEMYQGKDLFFKFNAPEILAHEFRENLEVNSAYFESSIADLVFTWENLELAEEFLDNLIDKYIERNLEKKNFDANNTIAYINNQLEIMSGTLGQSEEQLQRFQSSRDVMNIDEKSSAIYGQIQHLKSEQNQLKIQYQNLMQVSEYFEQNKDSDSFVVPSVGISDQTLSTLIQDLTALYSEKQNLISTNQLRNPRLRTVEISIQNINKVISDNLKLNINSVQNEINDYESRIKTLENEFSRLPQTQRQLMGLEREFSINNEVYTSLLDKRIQAQIAKASNKSDCEIIEPITFMEIATPSVKKVLVIALFLGIFFPSLYIIFQLFISNKILSREELKKYNPLPIAGNIPHFPKSTDKFEFFEPQSPVSEGFHTTRSNIIYYLLGEKNKCILVTSSIPNEGKTYFSIHLANSFASTNNKTVLLDFDLRKKEQILSQFNTKNQPGVSSYLIKQSEIDDIIIDTEIANMDYIHCGEIPPDPVSLISNGRMDELFEFLKKNYDYIILDTPPYSMVTDAFLLMKYTDLNLLVSRLGVVTKKALRNTMEDIQSKKFNNVYAIFNDISKNDKGYNEKYAYGADKKVRLSLFKRIFKRNK